MPRPGSGATGARGTGAREHRRCATSISVQSQSDWRLCSRLDLIDARYLAVVYYETYVRNCRVMTGAPEKVRGLEEHVLQRLRGVSISAEAFSSHRTVSSMPQIHSGLAASRLISILCGISYAAYSLRLAILTRGRCIVCNELCAVLQLVEGEQAKWLQLVDSRIVIGSRMSFVEDDDHLHDRSYAGAKCQPWKLPSHRVCESRFDRQGLKSRFSSGSRKHCEAVRL